MLNNKVEICGVNTSKLPILSREEKNGYLLLSNISSYTCNKSSCKDTPNEEIDTTKNFIVYKTKQIISII